jgi:hypothetical protein
MSDQPITRGSFSPAQAVAATHAQEGPQSLGARREGRDLHAPEGTPVSESLSDQGKSNLVSEHQHVYEVKGSGLSCWAECVVLVHHYLSEARIPESYDLPCGHKLNRGNGAVVGSRQKVEQAIRAA